MSTTPLTSCNCPGCGQNWYEAGTVVIAGTVPAEFSPDGLAAIGIELTCDSCEVTHEAWMPIQTFEATAEVNHVR